ncbi:MAG: MerR family transcriptional regulator [Clostridium sp.]
MDDVNINELSNYLKVSKDTLRYYEKIGLLTSKRRDNGYRFYNEENIKSLKYILALKTLGYTLSDIEWLLKNTSENSNCMDVLETSLKEKGKELENQKKIIEKKLTLIEEYIKEPSLRDEAKIDNLVDELVMG